ncbi:MAG: acetyl-CoA carboxylase biotin carboxylase subunit family protein [Myxococcota bacterium]
MKRVPFVLLVESGPPAKHDYLRRLQARTERLVLLRNSNVTAGKNRWADEIMAAEDCLASPFLVLDRLRSDVKAWRSRQPQGPWRCLTYQEEALPATTVVAAALGQIPPVRDASLVRDKVQMRQVWTKAGLPQPDYEECESSENARQAAERFGDCVVKPVAMMGSCGVCRVDGAKPDEVEAAFDAAMSVNFHAEDLRDAFDIRSCVIIEEFIDCELELSIEAAVSDGKLHVLAMVKKETRDQVRFEEIGHETPLQLDDDLERTCLGQLKRALEAVQVRASMVHAEFRIRAWDHTPVLVELGARLAGDRIPFLVQRSTGVCPFDVALHLADGGPLAEIPRSTAIRPAQTRRYETEAELKSIRDHWMRQPPTAVCPDHPEAQKGFVEW